MDKQRIYFPNLNGLRFIAAFLVIVHHIEQLKSIFKFDNYYSSPFIAVIGKLGVVLFFVLSGFLITYLLLAEENSFKNIAVKKFYIRRMLRIWPLYFIILILAFLILPNISIFSYPFYDKEVIYSNIYLKLFLYVFFLPNLAISTLDIIPYASQTWSIGTEEQFYLVWPVILNRIKKHRLILMLFIITLTVGIRLLLSTSYSEILPYKKEIKTFWSTFRIDCMAIGGIFSILYYYKSKMLEVLKNQLTFYITLIITIFLLINGISIPKFHYEFYAILFGIIILNFATNKELFISLENKILNYLGSISYGLYMYHPIGIALALYVSTQLSLKTNWFIYPLSIGLTILLAGFSYKYFESPILKFKDRFSNILSRSRA